MQMPRGEGIRLFILKGGPSENGWRRFFIHKGDTQSIQVRAFPKGGLKGGKGEVATFIERGAKGIIKHGRYVISEQTTTRYFLSL